jgi:hypothetical protein
MKATFFWFALVSFQLTSNAYPQGTCASGAALHGGRPISPFPAGAINGADPFSFPVSVGTATNALVRPTVSPARITVVDAANGLKLQGNSTTSTARSARLTVVSDDAPRAQREVKAAAATSNDEQSEPEAVADTTTATTAADAGVSDALKRLVGTWKAVARHGDGELTTVELRLDDRGWAELTVPGVDGKPSTIKRRAELDGQEFKLTGPDTELLLGQLIDVNSRQMVLARTGGQVTFVRP